MVAKISIITTTYNCVKYIEQSINSALEQSLKEIEIVCIDGGSTDGTCDYIIQKASDDKRVKLYMQEGNGIGAAKNTGIRKAVGEYITFLDADDCYVDPYALEILYTKAIENKAKVCGALRSILELDGSISYDPLHRNDLIDNTDGRWIDYRDRQYDYHFHSYIYDRSMILDSTARFAETCCYDDTHFFIRAMLMAEKFFIVPVEMYRYRMGKPYVWNDDQSVDALASLLDQLKLTDINNLEMLHWITMQRINYDYRENFVNSVKRGNLKTLELLLECNKAVNMALIRKMEKRDFPIGYLATMIRNKREDLKILYDDEHKVLLIPIWECLYKETKEIKKLEMKNKEIASLRDDLNNLDSEMASIKKVLLDKERELERITKSISYRIGRSVTWLPRMVRRIVRRHFG